MQKIIPFPGAPAPEDQQDISPDVIPHMRADVHQLFHWGRHVAPKPPAVAFDTVANKIYSNNDGNTYTVEGVPLITAREICDREGYALIEQPIYDDAMQLTYTLKAFSHCARVTKAILERDPGTRVVQNAKTLTIDTSGHFTQDDKKAVERLIDRLNRPREPKRLF